MDEFQNIATPEFLSNLQASWDDFLSESGIMMMVCGSHISTMDALDKRGRSPLYGRFTRRIVVNPLSFEEVLDRNRDFVDQVDRYAVLGGVPRYMELFDDRSLGDNVRDNVMSPSSPMYDDPRILLGDEVDRVGSYMSIMRAVANGNRKVSDISSAVEMPMTTIMPYIRKLQAIHMLERRIPVTEKNPEKSKSGLYQISDRYTAFWFRFVYLHMSELEMRNDIPAMKDFDSHFVEAHASFVFEDLCREQTRRMQEHIGFIPDIVGSYWSRNVEIDVVAINREERRAFVAECRYHRNNRVSWHVLDELIGKTASVDELRGYEITYGLFSVSGFDDRLMSRPGIVLVDKGEVIRT